MKVAAPIPYPASETRLNFLHSLHSTSRIWELVLVFGVYLLAGKIGLAIPFTNGNVSPLWPPAGVALAAILAFGYGVWPAVALGAFVVNFFSKIPHLAAVGIALGNTVGPLCGAWLLRRFSIYQLSFSRLRDVLGMIVLGALCGTAVSATIGTSVLFLTGVNAWSGFAAAWLMWWLGDGMGVLIVTPLVMTFNRLISIREKRQLVELGCLIVGAALTAFVIFSPRLGSMHADVFALGAFPFVLWGAIRFEAAGAAVVSLIIATISVWGTGHGLGPFVRGSSLQDAALLQAFLGVSSVSGIVLAAVISEKAKLVREQSTLEAVERSEESYRGIVETAYEGIWRVNSEYETSFVNRRMTELLGYSAEEMMGRPLFDFLFESDIEQKRREMKRRRRGVSEQLETRYRKKDGTALWARVATSPIIGSGGDFEGALAMVSDITEQKYAEAEACRSRETITLLSRALEQTADTVVITDGQGIIQYVNPAFEVTTGYSRLEALGQTPRILKSGMHGREFYTELWEQILGGEPFRGTLANRRKSGEVYWTEQTITPIRDNTGTTTHFVSVHKDVTEFRRKQEQELQLRLAREVQQRFYAGATISVAGFDIASSAYPAEETGGDYLDMFSMPDGRICIGIGDVSGHGLGSALVMALTRAYVRSFARVESDLARILTNVNHMLIADLENSRFVTLLLVCLDGRNGLLSFASAGHIPGFLMNCSGELDSILESSGPPLGLFEDLHLVTATIPLRQKQLMILLTDGVTEMAASEDVQFGTEGVLNYVRRHRQDSARDLAEGIYQAARSFAGGLPQRDDATEIVVRVA